MGNPNWKNRTLWTGDNLDIMRGMNSESVDLVYLDPPFNSNRLYSAPVGSQAAGAAFKDTWTLSDLDVAWMGLIADEHPAMYKVLDAAGTTHGKGMQSYLCMMGVRLIEMRRLLKPSGSIYLHCDPTANSYLKLLMDAVFGVRQFRTEIIWKRTTAHSDTKQGRRQHGRIHDTVLFYTKTDDWCWNPIYTEYEREYTENTYRFVDPNTNRRFQKDNLTAAKPGGDTLYEWRIKRKLAGEWEADLCDDWKNPAPSWEYRGVPPYKGRYWAYSKEKMCEFAREGRIAYSRTGMPRYKRYLDEMPGVPLQDLWTDISPPSAKERMGYPTQKPLALLNRIITASSNVGEMILDPFCGCATACVSADKLNRQWVGIDISPKAVELVNVRLRDELGDLYHSPRLVASRTDIPGRTDIGKPIPYRKNKHVLFGQQEGKCKGCGQDGIGFRNLEVDHKQPRSRGGTDHIDNLQLLCGFCNRTKGGRDQPYLIARLKELNII